MEKHFHAVYSSIIPRLCTMSLRSQEVTSALPNRLPQGSRIHSLSRIAHVLVVSAMLQRKALPLRY
jgi:hypothetical protein